jgi:hypothetical protein
VGDHVLGPLEIVARCSAPMRHREFEDLLRSTPSVTAQEFAEIVKFAADQEGQWLARWSLSPATAPDDTARVEYLGWHQLWESCLEELVEQVEKPELRDALDRHRRLAALQHAAASRLTSPAFQRVWNGFLSTLAIGLGRVGIDGPARTLYAMALYPAGSVGRRHH